MRAHASVATDRVVGPDGCQRSRASLIRGQAPLLLRLVEPTAAQPLTGHAADVARVCVAAGAAGPVGGDDYRLDVVVGANSTLVLTEVSPTLLLPGPCGAPSRMSTLVRVDDGATLIWLAQPVIAATECHHVNDIRVQLAAGARLLLREQLVLGRHGERPGRLAQRLRVRRGQRPLYHQEFAVDRDGSGWDGAAVAHRYRALASMLVVDPDWVEAGPATTSLDATAALLRLAGPAVVLSAVADDTVALARQLEAGLAAIGPPWCTT
jgi:urease accessory protein